MECITDLIIKINGNENKYITVNIILNMLLLKTIFTFIVILKFCAKYKKQNKNQILILLNYFLTIKIQIYLWSLLSFEKMM